MGGWRPAPCSSPAQCPMIRHRTSASAPTSMLLQACAQGARRGCGRWPGSADSSPGACKALQSVNLIFKNRWTLLRGVWLQGGRGAASSQWQSPALTRSQAACPNAAAACHGGAVPGVRSSGEPGALAPSCLSALAQRRGPGPAPASPPVRCSRAGCGRGGARCHRRHCRHSHRRLAGAAPQLERPERMASGRRGWPHRVGAQGRGDASSGCSAGRRPDP